METKLIPPNIREKKIFKIQFFKPAFSLVFVFLLLFAFSNALGATNLKTNEEKPAIDSCRLSLDTIVKSLYSDNGENIIQFSQKHPVISMYVSRIRSGGDYDIISKCRQAKVKYLKLSIENGIIKDILVYCIDVSKKEKEKEKEKGKNDNTTQDNLKGKEYCFSNRHYIPLRDAFDIDNLNTEHVNLLIAQISKSLIASIDLSDVLRTIRSGTLASGTYISADTTFTLPSKGIVVVKKSSIIDNLNLKVFTDVMGYEKNSINGVVQTEAKINFILNPSSNSKQQFTDEVLKINRNRHEWVWINRISPYIKWMRMENNNSSLSIESTTQGDVMNLFKYATLDMGTDFNVITYRTDSKLFTANLAAGIWRTKVVQNKNDSTDVNNLFVSTFYLNPTFEFKFYESDRLDFSLGVGVFGATKLGIISAEDLKNIKSKLTSYDFTSNHFWGQIQECVNFHPNGNWRNSIFLRANQYWNPKNSHFTFQIGYSTPLSNIFK
jgi:hypothetical protein